MKITDIRPAVAKFTLRHPVTQENLTLDDGTEVQWDVVGQDSTEYLTAQEDFLKKLQSRADTTKMTSIEYKKEAAVQLASLVKGWDEQFNDTMGGAFSNDYLISLLQNPDYGWMTNQLDAYVGNRKNFFPK